MPLRVGFTICSHRDSGQLLRLVRTLQRVYDNPPIVCHHDAGQTPIRLDEFPSEVRFVLPHLRTKWGTFSFVEAELRAIELLYDWAAPDWFVTLSGADYPTMKAEDVLKELALAEADVFIDFREVHSGDPNSLYQATENTALRHFDKSENMAIAWRRYMAFNAWLPIIRSGWRIGRHITYLPFESPSSPFGPKFKCFYGDHWFTGSHKAAAILLNPTDEHIKLRRYYRWRVCPGESYYQTVLGNAPGLKRSTATKRFAKWEGGPGAHPHILEVDDLPAIVSSKAYFARKFLPDAKVLDEIDRILS